MRKSKDPGRKSERARRSRSVAELLPRAGRQAFRRFGFAESAVVARWAEIVGPEYAAHSTPEMLRFPHGRRSGGTLTLAVSGAHALTIQHVEPLIIERVNRFFGYDAVSRIKIEQGHKLPPAPKARQRTTVDEAATLPAEMSGSLKAIKDSALRSSLEDLARQVAATSGPPKIK